MSIKQSILNFFRKAKTAYGTPLTVTAAVASLHKAVNDLEDVVTHHTNLSAAADKVIAVAQASKTEAENEVAAAKKVSENLKNLLGL